MQPGRWLLKRRYIKRWAIDAGKGMQYGLGLYP